MIFEMISCLETNEGFDGMLCMCASKREDVVVGPNPIAGSQNVLEKFWAFETSGN